MPEPGRRPAQPPEVSVVVPVYRCGDCLRPLYRRLKTALAVFPSSEIVFIDDRSPDDAWSLLQDLAREDPAVRAFRLSRNFGQHAAITAGLAQSNGRFTVVMDCDLQEPPEVIPELYTRALEGYDIVHTRRSRRNQSIVRRLAGRAYFRLRNVLLDTQTGTDHGTLSMLSRKVVDAFLGLRDKDREYLAVLDWLGYSHATIEFEHAPRHRGTSSYTWRKLARVAVDGLFFQTTILLRWIVLLGFLVALAGAGLAAYYLFSYFTSDPLPGYTSLAVLLLVLSGFIIISLGVIGLYVGKVFEQVKGRPLYLVDSRAAHGDEPERETQAAADKTIEEATRHG
jgi:glycosyltransferase involved in cell wall biosynthesis